MFIKILVIVLSTATLMSCVQLPNSYVQPKIPRATPKKIKVPPRKNKCDSLMYKVMDTGHLSNEEGAYFLQNCKPS